MESVSTSRARDVASLERDLPAEQPSDRASALALAQQQLGNGELSRALGGELGPFGQTVASGVGAQLAGLGAEDRSNGAMMRSIRGSAHAALSRSGPGIPDAGGVRQLIAQSSGHSLPGSVAARMGAALGHELSGVTIHTDPAAAEAAEALHAHAFALGSHIFFGPGEYAPGSPCGDELLAHELQHVVQYAQGQLSGTGDFSVSSPSDPSEVEARQVASQAMLALDGAGLGGLGGLGDLAGLGAMPGSPHVPAAVGPVMRDPLSDALGWVGDQVGGGLMEMVRAVSPELADLLENGVDGVIEDLLSESLEGFIGNLLGGMDLSSLIGGLVGEVQGVFAVIQGVIAGDPSCCETFDSWMQALSDFMTRLNDNPVAVAIREAMTTVGDVLGDMIALFAGAQLQGFLTMIDGAQAAWDGYTALIQAGQDAVKGLADWVWDGVCELLGIPAGEGNIVDHLLQMAQQWFSDTMDEQGPGILDWLQQVGQIWWENSQLKQFYDMIQAFKALWEAGTWLWENWGSPTMVEDAAAAGPLVQGFVTAFQTAEGYAQQFGTWAGEFFPSMLEKVQGFYESIGMGWFYHALELMVTPLLLPMQLGAEFGTWLAEGGVQTLSDWASAAWTYFSPILDVFSSIAMAVACPPMIPVILAGWAWRALPDCLKPPIVDLLLDVVLDALVAMPTLPGLDGLWSVLKPGIIGALAAFRDRSDDEKIIITNKVAKILSGSPEFVLGFVVGMLKGMLDGILDPLMLIWMVIEGVIWLVDFAGGVAESVTNDTEQTMGQTVAQTEQVATQATDEAAALADAPITLMAVDMERLQQQAAATAAVMAEAAPSAADPMTDPDVLAYLQRMGAEIRPPAEVIGETFMPAFEEAFSGEGATSISSLAEMMGSLWETVQELVGEAGQWIGNQICDLMLAESAEWDIGYGAGYIAGMVTFEVILAILTGGAWELLGPTARAIVKFIDLGGTMLGAAFRMLGDLGQLLMRAIRPLMDWVGSTPLMKTLKEAFSELAEKLVSLSDELMRMLGMGDEAADGARRAADNPVDDALDAGRRAGDGQADDGLDAVRRSIAAGEDAKLALAAQRIRPEPGVFDVVVHGDGDRLLMLEGGAWRELSPAELAARIRADGHAGESIRLISCGTGQADGAAARLSRELGVDVKAPTDTVWIHPDGTLTVGPTPDMPSGGWSRTSPSGSSEVVEDSARVGDDLAGGVDEAVPVGERTGPIQPDEATHIDQGDFTDGGTFDGGGHMHPNRQELLDRGYKELDPEFVRTQTQLEQPFVDARKAWEEADINLDRWRKARREVENGLGKKRIEGMAKARNLTDAQRQALAEEKRLFDEAMAAWDQANPRPPSPGPKPKPEDFGLPEGHVPLVDQKFFFAEPLNGGPAEIGGINPARNRIHSDGHTRFPKDWDSNDIMQLLESGDPRIVVTPSPTMTKYTAWIRRNSDGTYSIAPANLADPAAQGFVKSSLIRPTSGAKRTVFPEMNQ